MTFVLGVVMRLLVACIVVFFAFNWWVLLGRGSVIIDIVNLSMVVFGTYALIRSLERSD